MDFDGDGYKTLEPICKMLFVCATVCVCVCIWGKEGRGSDSFHLFLKKTMIQKRIKLPVQNFACPYLNFSYLGGGALCKALRDR